MPPEEANHRKHARTRLGIVTMCVFTLVAGFLSATLSTPAAALDTASDELRLLELTNMQRATGGVAPLKIWPPAMQVAREHSAYMAATGQFVHSPDWERVPQIWSHAAQNIGTTLGLSGDAAIQRIQCGDRTCDPLPPINDMSQCPLSKLSASDNAFLTSESHCRTLMNPAYNYIGIGVSYTASGQMYVTVDFFAISDPGLGFPGPSPSSETPLIAAPGPGVLPHHTWYFAEGYTGTDFETYITVLNTNATTANVEITLFLQGSSTVRQMSVPANSRRTMDVKDQVGVGQDVGAKVTADIPVVAERSMLFNYHGYIDGGSALVGQPSLGTDFYFAEGYTGPGFDTWLTVINPGGVNAPLRVTFMLPDGSTVVTNQYVALANRRLTINAKSHVIGSDISIRIESTSGVQVLAERPMYFEYGSILGGGVLKGGHVGAGQRTPATSFFFAEGYTGVGGGSLFEEWLTVQNPSAVDAVEVTFTYLREGGRPPVSETFSVGRSSRFTRFVNAKVPNESISVQVTSTGPIVTERPMYFSYIGWPDGHNAPGVAEKHRHWWLPDGNTRIFTDTWLTIANPNAASATITLRFYGETGAPLIRNVSVPQNARGTFKVNELAGDGKRVGIVVSSDQKVVVEKPMYYWNPGATGGDVAVGYGAG